RSYSNRHCLIHYSKYIIWN
ncbi:Hemagglutinin, partial [Monkeypox virus]